MQWPTKIHETKIKIQWTEIIKYEQLVLLKKYLEQI